MDENPYCPPETGEPVRPDGNKKTPFIAAFFGAMLLSFVISIFIRVSWIFILGGMVLLFLLALLTIGVFSPSPKPLADREAHDQSPRPGELDP